MTILYASKGCGSVIVEALFTLLGIEYERREVGIFDQASDELRAVNRLAQVPTVVLDDSTVLTESVAVTLWALERSGDSSLAPMPGSPERATFLRWLVYLPAAIYPMYTVGDVPEAWVGEQCGSRLRQATVERTLACWRNMEEQLAGRGDYVLGDELGVLDLFTAVISRWRPGREKIREVAPRLVAAAERTEHDRRLAPLFEREFGD